MLLLQEWGQQQQQQQQQHYEDFDWHSHWLLAFRVNRLDEQDHQQSLLQQQQLRQWQWGQDHL